FLRRDARGRPAPPLWGSSPGAPLRPALFLSATREARPMLKTPLRMLALTSALLVAGMAGAQDTATATATLRADQPGDTVSRYIFGEFAEHLGYGIYGGIWVGEDSKIPNTKGY